MANQMCAGCKLPISLHGVDDSQSWGCELAKLRILDRPVSQDAERGNCGTPPDHIWVHPWREMLYYSPTDQPDYIEYVRATAIDAARLAERQRIRAAVQAKAKQMGSYDGNDFYAVWLSDALAAIDAQPVDGRGE